MWSNTSIENHATIGSGLRPGWVVSIPQQYEKYRMPIPDTILMDGGGNDINSAKSDCVPFTNACKQVVDTLVNISSTLITTIQEDGVKNVIYTGFYYLPQFRSVVDYGTEELKKICLVKNRCYFVDLRNVSVQTGWDGMHPVEASYHDIAKEIWTTIQQHNITLT